MNSSTSPNLQKLKDLKKRAVLALDQATGRIFRAVDELELKKIKEDINKAK